MIFVYADRKHSKSAAPALETAQQPSVGALRTGAANPTQEQMGHRVDLPTAAFPALPPRPRPDRCRQKRQQIRISLSLWAV